MLKAPVRKIGGFGLFGSYKEMALQDAWSLYGLKNGMPSEARFTQRINDIAVKRSESHKPSGNPCIGCVELNDVTCLTDSKLFEPESLGHKFPFQIVKLKYFRDPDRLSDLFD